MVSEILLFFIQSDAHLHLIVDILLGSVLDAYITQFQWDLLVQDHFGGIGTSVHNIDFGYDTQCSVALWIPFSG